jgi:hypothetical protein
MNKDYEIGYGKPPKHSRFKPGQSGNPKGREKGSKGLRKIIDEETRAHETIRIGRKNVKAPRIVQTIRTLAIRAANGDLKAQQFLVPLVIQCFGFEDRGVGPAKLSAHDQAILDQLLSSYAAEEPPTPAADGDGNRMLPPPDAPPAGDEAGEGGEDE